MRRRTLLPGILLAALIAGAVDAGGQEAPRRRALVIGIDGLRPDALRAATTPVLDELISDGAVTWQAVAGGRQGSASEQSTSSGPGWSSILTGVWVDRHRVRDNAFAFNLLHRYPHFVQRLKEVRPDAVAASIVSWAPIEEQIVAPVADAFDLHTTGKGESAAEKDASVVRQAVEYLGRADPDVLFLHLDQIDGAGHGTGFSAENPDYLAAIGKVDELIGKVMTAVRERPTAPEEEWLVVVTTDHGGLNRSHGGQSGEERTIFFIASGGGTRPGEREGDAARVGHVAVPPTVMRHLALPIREEWLWEEPPFGFD